MSNSYPQVQAAARRNVRLYPWYSFLRNLLFWQATWFLFFQNHLSAAEAILLYAIYDVATTVLEVPSGYMSDRLGRRTTLILSATATLLAAILFSMGSGLAVFALGQILLGAGTSFASGTDSAVLFESLKADNRSAEVEAQEMRAWRFGFVALALSAASGGALALLWDRLPFVAGIGAGSALLCVTYLFQDMRRGTVPTEQGEIALFRSLKRAFRKPVLLWLGALSVAMYVASHVPYVFGQPFILLALERVGLQAEAPLISGLVAATMMVLSVAASWGAARLRRGFGLAPTLLFAFALQIGLIAGLAWIGHVAAIGLLLTRMIPDSLSRPFIVARAQLDLEDESRATFLSIKSLAGRLAFAGSLWTTTLMVAAQSTMTQAEIRLVLSGYALGGVLVWLGLAVLVRRARLEPR